MGTVGLSYGSPTGGAGFDVSSTVSMIVANLQKVEMPWKSQISTMQTQDTVISNLGTLLSNLSNDVSQLTDFTGIMAQKTGSSSDTNVLQLTAATSAASAGTHSVLVNSLASTSSGYMAELPSASTPLAIGSAVTLQVGNGTAQTITIDSSNNTLSGLAAAINNSGVGITASVLTDANGARLSLVSGTSGASGNITVSGNTLAAATPMSYSAASSTTGTLTGIPSSSDTLSFGSVTIQTSGNTAQTITLDSTDNTLTGLMNAINNNTALQGQQVTASIVTNTNGTQSLSLSSAGTALSVSTGNLTDNSAMTYPLGYTSSVTGANASLTVDGVNLTSTSNTVSNLIPGVTFQLLSQSPQVSGSPAPVQVIIGNDNTSIETTIASMVTDYNSLVSAINVQTGNTSSGTPEPLFGSPTLSLLQQQLMSALNTQNPNGTLTSIPSTGTTLNTSGSISIQMGTGTPTTIAVPSGNPTLQGLADAINSANIGVKASITTKNGQSTLALLSQTTGTAGALTVSTTNLTATDSNNNTTTLNYTNSSNISTLANLGISVSSKDDGTLTFDASVLDSQLNTNYSGVIGFFQSIDSWGQSFSQTLNNAGNTSSTGTLKLAQKSNSSIESTLNADIAREESLISVQQKSLTAELNSANEILQSIPTQLQGVNEIYSAISGYNSKQG